MGVCGLGGDVRGMLHVRLTPGSGEPCDVFVDPELLRYCSGENPYVTATDCHKLSEMPSRTLSQEDFRGALEEKPATEGGKLADPQHHYPPFTPRKINQSWHAGARGEGKQAQRLLSRRPGRLAQALKRVGCVSQPTGVGPNCLVSRHIRRGAVGFTCWDGVALQSRIDRSRGSKLFCCQIGKIHRADPQFPGYYSC